MPELRPHQTAAIEQLREAYRTGAKAPLLVLPTGAGKTIVAAEAIRLAIAKEGRVLFVAPRRELVIQASRKLRDAGVAHSIALAGADHHDPDAAVLVASIDTLVARARYGLLRLFDPSLIVVDEAHLFATKLRVELIQKRWSQARLLGLTATPIRKDGRAMGVLFDTLIEPTTVTDLTAAGFLVSAKYFSISDPDLARVTITAGDYNQGDLDGVMNRPGLVGDIVGTWLARAPDRRTVVFCTSIPHSIAVSEAFQRAGVAAEHVDANTPPDEREGVFNRFQRGETQVLCNVFLAAYGFDLPAMSCVVLARPTKSLMLYLQMIGRVLRPSVGKDHALVIDHAGCVHVHGFADELREWTLDGHRRMVARSRLTRPDLREQRILDCPECRVVFAGSRICPECGYRFMPAPVDVEVIEGELVPMRGKHIEIMNKRGLFAELRAIAVARGHSTKWPSAKYHELTDQWPPRNWHDDDLVEPSITTLRRVRASAIRFAKRKEREARNGSAPILAANLISPRDDA